MKRYIKNNSGLEDRRYTFKVPRTKNTYTFSGVINRATGSISGQVSRIAAYDDADYYWAKVEGNGQVKFIHDGKVVDKMQMWSYDEEDYENIDDYINDIVSTIADDLDQYNDEITPRMMYN